MILLMLLAVNAYLYPKYHAMNKVATFLMFSGKAEEAMNLYTSAIPRSAILTLRKYCPNEGGAEGSIMHATFALGDQQFACIDSSASHAFGFTPATSISVTCDSDQEVDEIFSKLGVGGKILMPLGPYPFSKRYVWFDDKFGVSWQLTSGL